MRLSPAEKNIENSFDVKKEKKEKIKAATEFIDIEHVLLSFSVTDDNDW